MPKIRIKEFDNTSLQDNALSINAVYIPGKAANHTEPEIYRNISDLNKVTGLIHTTIAYALAKKLLNLGIPVVYEGFNPASTSEANMPTAETLKKIEDKAKFEEIRFLCAGDFAAELETTSTLQGLMQNLFNSAKKRGDCVALLDHPQALTATAEETYVLLVTKPEGFDPTKYCIKTLEYSSVATGETFAANKFYTKVTDEGTGKETYVLLDTKPANWDTECTKYYYISATNYTAGTASAEWAINTWYKKVTTPSGITVANVRNFFEGIETKDLQGNDFGSYGAAFTPWFYTQDASFTDGAEEIALPASFGYLCAFAKDIKTCNEWEAMAGSARGIIDILYRPCKEYTSAECEMLQARATTEEVELDDEDGRDNQGKAINAIMYVRPSGYIIWGNRTLTDNKGTLKASAFLNVRNLVTSVKKYLYATARKYTFELNSDLLWSKFRNDITPNLNEMVTGNGLLGYRFTRETTTQKARLKAKLVIVPIEAVEDFDLVIELTDALTVSEG